MQPLSYLATGQKFQVYVWFNDTQEWYLGEVCDYNKEDNNYLIKWLEVDEEDEWVSLDEENHTLGKSCNLVLVLMFVFR
jgi:hypothetical protein